MSKAIPLNFAVQLRVYCKNYRDDEELSGIGEIREITVLKTNNRNEAYCYFENLKSKDNEIQGKIRRQYFDYERIKPFFEARIVKYTPKEVEVVGWTWMLKRHIEISYRCKIIVDNKSTWTKKIYYVPPILIDSHSCPSNVKSREAKAFACGILRTFLPIDGFKLEKITATFDEISSI